MFLELFNYVYSELEFRYINVLRAEQFYNSKHYIQISTLKEYYQCVTLQLH